MDTTDEVFDVIIVGAGPCGLATAARLRENTPAALFTDEEHRRYHWIGKHGNKVSLKHVKSGKVKSRRADAAPEYKMIVLDDTADEWMARWDSLFATYNISHLRSPMIWHADPFDRDSLLAYTYENSRESELVEIRNCVGKEISKHGHKKQGARHCGGKQSSRVAINVRDRNDYYTPSAGVFRDHCNAVCERYSLASDLVHKESVLDIDFGYVEHLPENDEELFTVKTETTTRFARSVVLAVGPANVPKIPSMPSMVYENGVLPQACHSMQVQTFPDPIVQRRIQDKHPTNIAVIGGGLTSAQVSDLAIRKGVTKVWHIMRGPLRVKLFDLDLEWMGKYKNTEQARFWLADSDEERLEIIKSARGGGSVTPAFNKVLKRHISTGKLELKTNTRVVDAAFTRDSTGRGAWRLVTEPPVQLPPMDYIYFATGIQTDFQALPYLDTIMAKHPIPGHAGLPCLTNDLMWKEGVPLFLVGRLAALRLGPGSANLGGAMVGAERVAWEIEDVVRKSTLQDNDGDGDASRSMDDYLKGHGNMYSTLMCDH